MSEAINVWLDLKLKLFWGTLAFYGSSLITLLLFMRVNSIVRFYLHKLLLFTDYTIWVRF